MTVRMTNQRLTVFVGDTEIELVREDPREPWDINFPWGCVRFYGTPAQAKALARKRQAEIDNA